MSNGKQTIVQDGELPASPTLEESERRVSQLQHALTSRLILEQAKGILRERYGLNPDQAFDLLRTTARNNRTNLHHLATEIVEKQETPGALIETLARSHHAHIAHEHQVTQLGRLASHIRQHRLHQARQQEGERRRR